jgi:hypothetical protein
MNKQKNRYTPFDGDYKMPVDLFCKKYGLSLKLIMHRMNVLYWEDFDALVIPQEVGDTSADKVRRTLILINQGWSHEAIRTRMGIDLGVIDFIANMDDYRKKMFLEMDSYFFLNPDKIDVSKIFVEVDDQEVAV